MTKPIKSKKLLTSTLWFHYLVDAMTAMGLDGMQLAQDAGMEMDLLANPEAALPDELTFIMLHKAVRISGKPDFGLQAANIFKPSAFGAMGYSMMSAPTLKDSLIRSTRYAASVTQASSSKLTSFAGGARFEIIQPLPVPLVPDFEQTYEFLTLLMLNFLRWLVGFEIKPQRAEFIHPTPSYSNTHAQFFGCPVYFNTGHTTLVFSDEQLAIQLITADAMMAVFHDRLAEQRASQLGSSPITIQTRRLITQMLPEGEPARQQIASLLNLNERTLQRRLLVEGASFSDILNEIRRNLAEMYLANGNITLQESASLLGFSEQSSFNRAARRWFNSTPQQLRHRLLESSSVES